MKRIEVGEFGGPEVMVLVEVPDPVAVPGEAVVRVEAADVLHVETAIRSGFALDFFPQRPPYVPGGAVAGTVLEVGDAGDVGWVGRRVALRTGQGGYAERVVAPVSALVEVPDGVEVTVAAALMHDGPTALGILDNARITSEDRVLITAAAGGMGLLLLQFAVAQGARVVGAARGEKKLGLVAGFGALPVDYSEPGWTGEVTAALEGAPTVVLDGAGTGIGLAAFEILAEGGRFSAHGSPSGGFTEIPAREAARRAVTVRGIEQVQFTPEQVKPLVKRALTAVAAGVVHPFIGQMFPLEQAARAHEALESRTALGKTLLLP